MTVMIGKVWFTTNCDIQKSTECAENKLSVETCCTGITKKHHYKQVHG